MVNSSELSRVLSNLINNAVEAIQDDNRINISLSDLSGEAVIQIQDYGKGIPPHLLGKIGTLGGTFGKTQGTGVGLNHAINTIKEWGGSLTINSQEANGTTIKIYLPKAEPSPWFASKILISDGQLVVVIDDDEAIHKLWENKFRSVAKEKNLIINLLHFYSPLEFVNWRNNPPPTKSVLYLCDYEFVGSDLTGVELIKKLKLHANAILVTSHLANEVISLCESEEIKLLPKNTAYIFPIVVSNGSEL